MRKLVVLLAIIALGASFVCKGLGSQKRGGTPAGTPNSRLSKHVKAPEGQLTLFADFDVKNAGHVPVYVVNRTGKPILFRAQDGDIFIKLEYEAGGKWVRAQPHRFSKCGNSYDDSPQLDPETFMVVQGHAPAQGAMAKVRYAIYEQEFKAATNTGMAFVSAEEIKKAANDVLTLKSGDFAFVLKVAKGEIQLKNETNSVRDMREYAIYRLATNEQYDQVLVAKTLSEMSLVADKQYAKAAGEYLRYLSRKKAEKSAN